MSVEFMNAYNEVLHEYFDAILKQNLTLQTQLKLNEKIKKESEENNKNIDIQTQNLVNSLTQKDNYIAQLENTISDLNIKINSFELSQNRNIDVENIINEKNRIQQALNETLQKNLNLQNELNEKQSLIIKMEEKNSSVRNKKSNNFKSEYIDGTNINKENIQSDTF